MARSLDAGKLDAWRSRFARFEGSGLTVAAFCRKEKISPARFYYWSRRVRDAVTGYSQPSVDDGVTTSASPASVEVLLGEHMTIRLPATDPAWIASVLMNLQASKADSVAQASFARIDLSEPTAVAR